VELLTYSIENRGNLPVYMYIYECIRRDILSGKIQPGERLPSKRPLAAHLGVAIITIENAYAQLITEGYVQSREKRGYFVSEDMKDIVVLPDRRSQEAGNALTSGGKEQNTAGDFSSGIKDQFENPINAATSIFADFSASSIKSDSFPFDSWAKLMRRSMLDHEVSFLEAPSGQGVQVLREAISDYLYKSKGMNVDAQRIIVGPGTEYLHHILIQLLGRNCFVAVEDPGYNKVGRIYETNGVRVLHIPVDEKGMIIDRLKDSNVKMVHTSPSHHFPTGSVMPADRRNRLLTWALSQDAYIIEDDYDSEFRFEGRPIATLYSMDGSHVIYMNTFTRTLAPSIRIAYMVLPEVLHRKYLDKLYFYSGTVSGFEQYTLASFIGEGYYERHIRRMRNRYKKCRSKMLEALRESGALKVISLNEDKAGLQLSFRVRDEYVKNAMNLDAKMLTLGVKIVAVKSYCYNAVRDYDNSYLLYYSDIDKMDMIKAFSMLKSALEN